MTSSSSPIELRPGQAITLDAAPGLWLRVWGGRLWVTATGDPNDYFVAAGQTLALGPGRLVLEADAGPARYSLLRPAAAQSGWSAASRRISWRTMSDCISR